MDNLEYGKPGLEPFMKRGRHRRDWIDLQRSLQPNLALEGLKYLKWRRNEGVNASRALPARDGGPRILANNILHQRQIIRCQTGEHQKARCDAVHLDTWKALCYE